MKIQAISNSKEIRGTIIPYTAPSVPKDSRALYGVGKVKFCHLFCRTQRLLNVQEFSSLDQDMKRGLVEPDNLGLSAPFLKFICLERLPPAWRNPRNGCLCTEISRAEIPNTAWIKPSFSIPFFSYLVQNLLLWKALLLGVKVTEKEWLSLTLCRNQGAFGVSHQTDGWIQPCLAGKEQKDDITEQQSSSFPRHSQAPSRLLQEEPLSRQWPSRCSRR